LFSLSFDLTSDEPAFCAWCGIGCKNWFVFCGRAAIFTLAFAVPSQRRRSIIQVSKLIRYVKKQMIQSFV
jgi:hypothetical protein